MPLEFYPVDLTAELESKVSNAVKATVEAWKPKETNLKPTSLENAEQIVSEATCIKVIYIHHDTNV